MQAWSSVLQLVVTRCTLFGERSIKILEQGQRMARQTTRTEQKVQAERSNLR